MAWPEVNREAEAGSHSDGARGLVATGLEDSWPARQLRWCGLPVRRTQRNDAASFHHPYDVGRLDADVSAGAIPLVTGEHTVSDQFPHVALGEGTLRGRLLDCQERWQSLDMCVDDDLGNVDASFHRSPHPLSRFWAQCCSRRDRPAGRRITGHRVWCYRCGKMVAWQMGWDDEDGHTLVVSWWCGRAPAGGNHSHQESSRLCRLKSKSF